VDDSPTINDFKRGLHAALDDCFTLGKADTTSHPATKQCKLFLESLRNTAYEHVRALTSEAAASLPTMTGMLMRVRHCQPSAPRQTAGRSESLKLLAAAAVPRFRLLTTIFIDS